MKLSRLEEITDLTTVWPNEDNDFTEWLAKEENINLLSESIGLELSSEEIQSLIGNFNDNVISSAETEEPETNRSILIVSNLSSSDDSELGRLIALASAKNSELIVWVVRHSSESLRTSADWLNSRTNDSTKIFLCTLRLFRIGNSEPAVKFESVSTPFDSPENVPALTETHEDIEKLRFDYWEAFQDYAFDGGSNPKFAAGYKRWPTSSNYGVVFGTGRPGCSIIIAKNNNDIEAGLNISDDRELFNHLITHRDVIEAECGLIFEWLELSDGKGNRIRTRKSPALLTDKSSWPEQFDWIMSSVLKIREAFGKYINLHR